ncbi:kinase-like domain-containing protein [Mycena crocata]|nr:kinase-like domain-containing protein [Mycena crocata]
MPCFSSKGLPDLTGHFVDEVRFQLVKLIGSGATANVYKALDTSSSPHKPMYYAIKCMRQASRGSRLARRHHREFRVHKAVSRQPGVVDFHFIFTEGPFVFIVMDLGAEGTMLDAIKEGLFVDRPGVLRAAFIQLLDAVEQCHDKSVFHRDLKPENVLYDARGRKVQLVDFGLATQKEKSREFKSGSAAYLSPECADPTRGSYSPRRSDLWALAIILFSLSTGKLPWGTAHPSDARYDAFRADEPNYLRTIHHLTPTAAGFFNACFALDPRRRPTLEQMREAVLDMGSVPFVDAAARARDASEILNLLDVVEASFLGTPTLTASSCGSSFANTSTTSSTSNAGPATPPNSAVEPPVEVADLLEAVNDELADVEFPPLVPVKITSAAACAPKLLSNDASNSDLDFIFVDGESDYNSDVNSTSIEQETHEPQLWVANEMDWYC